MLIANKHEWEEYQRNIQNAEKQRRESETERHKEDLNQERTKSALILAKKKAQEKTIKFKWLKRNNWIPYIVGGIVLLVGIQIWLFEFEPVYSSVISLLPDKVNNNVDTVWVVLSAGLGLFSTGLMKFIENLGDENREKRLTDKYYKEYMETLSKES